MSRRVKEFVDIGDHVSLDELIQKLAEVRDSLPEGSEAQTEEEAELEKRYAEQSREAKEKELARLQAELGVVCYAAPGKRGKLRIVA